MKNVLFIAFALLLPMAAWAMIKRDESAVTETVDTAITEDYPATLEPQSFLESISLAIGNFTRGERNNNPGNIRISGTPWQGKTNGADSSFETFADPTMGIRAIAVLLKNYQQKSGLKTIRQIINRYAPASENNTSAYVSAVASDMGVRPDDPIDLNNDATLQSLVTAIIRHENGRIVYDASTIQTGVNLA